MLVEHNNKVLELLYQLHKINKDYKHKLDYKEHSY